MLQYEYYNVNLQQNTALKIRETVGVLTPPNGFAFGVLSALTNLETVSSEIIQNYNSVLINTLGIRVATCDEMVAYTEINFAKKQEVILKKEEMPSASADLVGAEYQYVGQDTTNYTHGYIYECRATENNTLTFDPNIMSCSWDNLSAFLSQQTSDYNSVVKGTLTYIGGGDLWRLVAMDAEDNVILSYQQYTGDWEAVGFTFTGTYEDGDVVSFERNTTATYAWVRVDVQPDLTSYIDGQISIVQADISDIEALIPAQASTSNQLADKNFVNSSISTNTANFIGTFNSVAELEAYSGTVTNNDYAFVIGTDSAGNTTYNRYKYNGNTQQWIYEYTLNNSSFTAAQWAAIQSGITAAKVSTYDGYATTIAGKQDIISDLATIRAGAAAGATAVQPGDLATVATSGSYNDLSDKPTIGDGTITVRQGGITRGTISVNQTNDTTIDLEAGGSGISPGIIVPFAGSVIPAGFLLCDGSAVSRTDYADLFDVIGTTYGAGDGSTTFNLPKLNTGDPVLGAEVAYIGQKTDGSLPNITGAFPMQGRNCYGAFLQISASGSLAGVNWNATTWTDFNASRSSSVYTNGQTRVKSAGVYVLYIIKY